jgi:hypothetical protein
VVATLGTLLPGCASPARTVVPAHSSPRLGELVVVIGWVPGWEEDHVVAVAKRHEFQTPEPNHSSQRKWTFRVSHLEKWHESDVDTRRTPI